MDMKRLTGVLVLAVLAAGCQKKDKHPTTGMLPNSCSYSAVKMYIGVIPTLPPSPPYPGKYLDIPVTADETIRADKLTIYLCRNIDCTTQPLPSTSCASYGLSNVTAPCFTTSPSPYIVTGAQTVRFVNVDRPGYTDQAHLLAGTPDIPAYSSYVIFEQLCQ